MKREVVFEKGEQGTEEYVRVERDRKGMTYIWCGCNSHMITVWWADEWAFDIVELSFWHMPTWRDGFLQRLQHIWRIIRHGTPYPDHLTLCNEEMEIFISTLQTYHKQAKEAAEKRERELKEKNDDN